MQGGEKLTCNDPLDFMRAQGLILAAVNVFHGLLLNVFERMHNDFEEWLALSVQRVCERFCNAVLVAEAHFESLEEHPTFIIILIVGVARLRAELHKVAILVEEQGGIGLSGPLSPGRIRLDFVCVNRCACIRKEWSNMTAAAKWKACWRTDEKEAN